MEWWNCLNGACGRGKKRSVLLKSYTPLILLCWFNRGITVPFITLTFLAVMIYEYNLLLTLPWFFWLQNEVFYTAGESTRKADLHPVTSPELLVLVGSYVVIKAKESAQRFAKARSFCRFTPVIPSSLTVKTGYGKTGRTSCSALSESAVINLRLYEWWGSGSSTQD